MSPTESNLAEPQLTTRRAPLLDAEIPLQPKLPGWMTSRRTIVVATVGLVVLIVLGVGGYFYAQHWVRSAALESLPQVDGTLSIAGLTAPVTVARDAQGLPHIRAASMDDLLIAQGYVTAQDRLFQMDLLRRHAAGELAEILGKAVIGHDRLQRTLQVGAAADRALAQLPPSQLHVMEQYAAGVNASIAQQAEHLPIEFRILRYKPAPWTPRDSLLVTLAMFEDLTNVFPMKLARESLVSRLPADGRAELEQDLYPVGSWRDHPPAKPIPDLTIEGPPIEDVPLDESQWALGAGAAVGLRTELATLFAGSLALMPGSNNWVVSGEHTASGKPLLSNDMHLSHTLPGIWYEADLEATASGAEPFHAAGVALPGVPLIVVGHNNHVAWGFTNLGGDVQDVYIETTRGVGASEEFQATDGSWQPVLHLPEPIKVKGGDPIPFEVLATRHGDAVTPILNTALTPDVTAPGGKPRTLSLRWTIYDPAAVQIPTLEVDSAHDWTSFKEAFRNFGGPAQNVVYADDRGHIGYHAMGKIPLRGGPEKADSQLFEQGNTSSSLQTPTIRANPDPLDETQIKAPASPAVPLLSGPLSAVPTVPSADREWKGYIPFDELPQVFDPAGGVIATANARVTPDDYGYPISQNWAAPYRNERIWRLLAHKKGLKPEDMLAIQMDIYSDFDRMLAERLTYAIDHALTNTAAKPRSPEETSALKQAAELLRKFDGRMLDSSAAASVISAAHAAIWPMLLAPKLPKATAVEIRSLYLWHSSDYALEQILMHMPPRWLPAGFSDWNEFLAAAVLQGLKNEKAPAKLAGWNYGGHHVVDIEHPIFDQSEALRKLIGVPTGTGPQPQSGDHTTIKQVDKTFGPSERFTADLSNLDHSTLNIVVGQSGNPMSPWFMNQFTAWRRGTTFPLAFSDDAVKAAAIHTLTLVPR
jgi:penicillin amidase